MICISRFFALSKDAGTEEVRERKNLHQCAQDHPKERRVRDTQESENHPKLNDQNSTLKGAVFTVHRNVSVYRRREEKIYDPHTDEDEREKSGDEKAFADVFRFGNKPKDDCK